MGIFSRKRDLNKSKDSKESKGEENESFSAISKSIEKLKLSSSSSSSSYASIPRQEIPGGKLLINFLEIQGFKSKDWDLFLLIEFEHNQILSCNAICKNGIYQWNHSCCFDVTTLKGLMKVQIY
eukprot:Sdes_comp10260_c0_seq1m1894